MTLKTRMLKHSPVEFVPYSLQHRRRGLPRFGKGREAGGLILRGVVIATYLPGDPLVKPRLPTTSLETDGVVCDVYILDAGYRAILQNVPVMLQSAGLNDYEGWVPRASTVDVLTGIMSISPEGIIGAPVSNAEDLDGDFVVVGFMADDMNQPVIMGQLPHPRNNDRPRFLDLTKFKYRRKMRGITWGVTNDGNVEIDLSFPTSGVVPPALPGLEIVTPPPISGNILIKMAPIGFLTIADSILSVPSLALLGDNYLTSLSTYQTSETAWLGAMSTMATATAAFAGASGAYATAAGSAATALSTDPVGFLPSTVTALGAWATAAGTMATAAATYATAAGTWTAAIASHVTAQGVFSTETTTSLVVGLPFLSSHVQFD